MIFMIAVHLFIDQNKSTHNISLLGSYDIHDSSPFILYKIAFDWANYLMIQKIRTVTSQQDQSWLIRLLLYLISHKWVQCWFSGQNSQLPGQIFFCPDDTFKNYFEHCIGRW